MTYEEKNTLAHLVSTILVIGGFVYYVLSLHGEGAFATPDGLVHLGRAVLVMVAAGIVVSIAASVLLSVVSGMIHNARHGEDEAYITDERDELLELKAMRVASYSLGVGFVLAMIALALGHPAYLVIVYMVLAGALADVLASLTKLYLYRRGG